MNNSQSVLYIDMDSRFRGNDRTGGLLDKITTSAEMTVRMFAGENHHVSMKDSAGVIYQ